MARRKLTNRERKAKYGHTAHEVSEQLVEVWLFGKQVKVHRKVAPRVVKWNALVREFERQHNLPHFVADDVSVFCWRRIRGGVNLSMHSWAIAIDINSATNPMTYKRHPKTDLPERVTIYAKHSGVNFFWGMNFKVRKDPMHFEYQY